MTLGVLFADERLLLASGRHVDQRVAAELACTICPSAIKCVQHPAGLELPHGHAAIGELPTLHVGGADNDGGLEIGRVGLP